MLRVMNILVAAFGLASIASSAWGQEQIPWVTDLRQARQMAEQQQRVVLLHFWSESCPPCRLLEQNVFNQPEVIRVISSGFIPVKINVLQQPKYADFYKIDRVPTDILVDHTGKELYRTTSPQKMDGYIAMLSQVRAEVGVNAGRALEAMAQNPLQKFQSALPPMQGSQDEVPASESINGDPTAAATDAPPWQSVAQNVNRQVNNLAQQANNLSQQANNLAQQARVENHFTTAESTSTPKPSEVSARQENPYVQGGDPANQTNQTAAANQASANSPTNSSRPWEASTATGTTAGAESSATPPSVDPQSVAPPNMPANMSPPNQNSFATGQPAGSAPPNGGMVLPSNVPPLALDGYCPVTLVLGSKWVKGDPRFGAIHRGRTYLLGSQADQQRFLAEPDRFSPALMGYDPVRFAETGQLVDGKREHGLFLPNIGYYLFADEASLTRFHSQPQGYVNVVKQAMANLRPTPQR